MSVIAIVLDDIKIPAQASMRLSRTLDVSFQALKEKISTSTPVLEIEIFDGDYASRSALLRAIMGLVESECLAASYYEIPYGQQFDNSQASPSKTSAQVIKNILDSADEELLRQLDN